MELVETRAGANGGFPEIVSRLRTETRDVACLTMAILKRRSQLVTFRVSAEEHHALVKSCMASGARSIAEFARASVLQRAQMLQANSGSLRGGLSGDLTTLSEALGELDASLMEMRKRIRGVLGPSGQFHEETSGEPDSFSSGAGDLGTNG